VKQTSRQHSFFELITLIFLVIVASYKAAEWSVAGLLPWLHGLFLLTAYLLVRLVADRLHARLGVALFAVTALYLITEIVIQQTTGLHFNLFILSLMQQSGFTSQIGVSGYSLAAVTFFVFAVALIGAQRLKKPFFVLQGRILLASTLALGIAVQGLYGLLFFVGAAEVEDVRRKLPLFTALHPYRSGKILGLVLNERAENPFANRTEIPRKLPDPAARATFSKGAPNIVLVVTDSLRVKELRADRTLAPNLMAWAQSGSLSLDAYSTSNCTHFSFYSMFTGKLPTGFGQARRSKNTVGMLRDFEANGYTITTAEANPLDLYDVASFLFPKTTERYIALEENGARASDQAVTNQTLKILKAAVNSNQPFFHLAYYFGTHYPYDTAFGDDAIDGHTKYLASIRSFDEEIGKLKRALEKNGQLGNTVVIITSDHGEEFLDTGRIGHASRLTDEQVKIPMVIIAPEQAKADPARVRSHMDLMPYILQMVGVETEPGSGPIFLANCSYDFPKGFAVISLEGRADFSYLSGYLTPIRSPNGALADPALQSKAAAELLVKIKN